VTAHFDRHDKPKQAKASFINKKQQKTAGSIATGPA
jgi:hypothetical protein